MTSLKAWALCLAALCGLPVLPACGGGPQPYRFEGPVVLAGRRPFAREQVQLGANVELPVLVTEDSDFATVGAGLSGFIGYDFGYITPFVALGWQYQEIDLGDRSGSEALIRNSYSLGLKAELENRLFVQPFVSLALDMNFWNLEFDDHVVCGVYYCYEERTFRFTPGFSGRLGAAFKVSNQVSLDAGLGAQLSFEGSVFPESEVWLTPFVGVTGYLY